VEEPNEFIKGWQENYVLGHKIDGAGDFNKYAQH
jgi:hypothetical protein